MKKLFCAFLLLASFTAQAAKLADWISYEQWLQLVQVSLEKDPVLEGFWKTLLEKEPEQAKKVFLFGGLLRGRLRALEEEIVTKRRPFPEVLAGPFPSVIDQQLQLADLDFLNRGKSDTFIHQAIENSFPERYQIWEVIEESFYLVSIQRQGPTLDKLAINPWAISDPLESLRDYYQGKLTFRFGTQAGEANLSAQYQGFNALSLAMRFLRHTKEHPSKAVSAHSWRALESALAWERGSLQFSGDHLEENKAIVKYGIEKALKKLFTSVGSDPVALAVELRKRGALDVVAEGPYVFPLPNAVTDTAGYANSIIDAGFSTAEQILVRRITDFETYDRWLPFQKSLVARAKNAQDRKQLVGFVSGADDLSYLARYYRDTHDDKNAKALALAAIEHWTRYPLLSSHSVNEAGMRQYDPEKSKAAIARNIAFIGELAETATRLGVVAQCQQRVLHWFEQEENLGQNPTVRLILTLWLQRLRPFGAQDSERLKKLALSSELNRDVEKIFLDLAIEALQKGDLKFAIEPLRQLRQAFSRPGPLPGEVAKTFEDGELRDNLDIFFRIENSPTVDKASEEIESWIRERLASAPLDYRAISLLLRFHTARPLPEELTDILQDKMVAALHTFELDWAKPETRLLATWEYLLKKKAFKEQARDLAQRLEAWRLAGGELTGENAQWICELAESHGGEFIDIVNRMVVRELEDGTKTDLFLINRWKVFVAPVTQFRPPISLLTYLEIALRADMRERLGKRRGESEEETELPSLHYHRQLLVDLRGLVDTDPTSSLNARTIDLDRFVHRRNANVRQALKLKDLGVRKLKKWPTVTFSPAQSCEQLTAEN